MRRTLVKLTSVLGVISLGTGMCVAATASRDVVATVPSARNVMDLGRAPAAAPVSIAVTLNYRNELELEQLVTLQSDPASPLFRQFLSSAEFNAAYAPSNADYQRVVATLQSAGFHIAQTYANNTVVDAVGTVASANALFATEIHSVNQRGYGLRLANVLPARLPASLNGIVEGVTGLQTLTLVKPAYAFARRGSAAVAPAPLGSSLYGPVSTVTGFAGFGPLAFLKGYDFPAVHTVNGKTYDGAGRTSGVVIDADFLDSDLAAYLSYFHVMRTGPKTVRIKVDGGPPGGDGSSDSLETTLDVEALVSTSPGTKLYVYEMPSFNSDQYITDAYNKVVSDNLVDTANSSFGGCETGDPSGAKTWDHIATQGAAKGITFHASTGDFGSDECSFGANTVSMPASGPHFAAIGGTSLRVDSTGQHVSETAWNSDGFNATGGGVSQLFALPSWQSTVPGVIRRGRNLPDVSFDADPNTGMALYYRGTWNSNYNPSGGTSLSSPLYGSALTEVNQFEGGRSGLAAVAAYRVFARNGYSRPKYGALFHDITAGCNATTSAGYCAKKGYDQATGIGSIVWWHFLE